MQASKKLNDQVQVTGEIMVEELGFGNISLGSVNVAIRKALICLPVLISHL